MTQKIKYTNEPIEARVVRDFLPPPEELAFKEDNVKVTMSLSRSSVDFFKQTARKRHTHYQKMIRNLLDAYTAKYK
jgi:predicted DNA binding CopG/RHH family protein